MVLSLSDILAAQQVSTSSLASSFAASASTSATNQLFSFQDVLNNQPAKVAATTTAPAAAPVPASSTTTAAASNSNNTQDTTTTSNDTADKAAEKADKKARLLNLYNALKNKQLTGAALSDDNLKTLEEITPRLEAKGDGQDITSTLQTVSGAATTHTLTQAELNTAAQNLQQTSNLTPDQLKTLNDVLTKLAGQKVPAGVSADKVANEAMAQINASSGDNSVTDILNKMNFANNNQTDNLTTAQLAQQLINGQQVAGTDIGKLASQVLEVAKDEASKPEIPSSSIRLTQVASLVKLGKKNDKQNATDGSAIDADLTTGTDASTMDTKDLIEKAQAALTANSNTYDTLQQKNLDNTWAQLANTTQAPTTNNQQVNLAASQQATLLNNNISISDAVKQLSSQVGAAASNDNGSVQDIDGGNPVGGLSSENFVKFQSMLNDASSLSNDPATKAASAQDVIAQIKFGLTASGSASKDEQNISIQLHPKDLGKVDITMQMSHDGKTHVMVVAENTDTLNLLQKESGSLKDMLSDALKTDSGNLNFSFQQNNSGTSDWKQQIASSKSSNSGVSGLSLGNDYLSSQSYKYNMIATQGLDIRV